MFFSRTTNCYDDIKFMKNKMSRMIFTKKTYDFMGKTVTQFCLDEHKKLIIKKKTIRFRLVFRLETLAGSSTA